MAAQRHHPTAGPPDIAQQALDDGRGADDLHAMHVMRPADRVAERTVRSRPEFFVSASQTRRKTTLRTAGHTLHHLRRIALIVVAHDLIDAARMLQRWIGWRRVPP